MKTCENCYYADKCSVAGRRCDDYDRVYGSEYVVLHEYKQALQEREEEYQKVIDEQNS